MASVSTLVSNIRKLLDMNNASEALVTSGDIDALSLNDVVEGVLVSAARYIETNAPAWLVDGKAIPITTGATTLSDDEEAATVSNSLADEDRVTQTSNTGTMAIKALSSSTKKVVVTLPTDFIRLLTFKLTDWERPALTITEDDPRYALQSSPWGLKGTAEAPVAVIVKGSSGLELHAYSSEETSPAVEKALYVPLRTISGTGTSKTMELSSKLQSAIEYYAAYLVCLTYGNGSLAGAMLNQAMTLAEIPTQPVVNQSSNNE